MYCCFFLHLCPPHSQLLCCRSYETKVHPYKHIYLEYKYFEDGDLEDDPERLQWNMKMQSVYKKWPSHVRLDYTDESLLRGVDRLKLILGIIASTDGGCGLDLDRLVRAKCVQTCSPLHDPIELRLVEAAFTKCWPSGESKADVVKNYFGEELGLYFMWLQFYTNWLTLASAVGVLIWLYVAVANDANAPDVPYCK